MDSFENVIKRGNIESSSNGISLSPDLPLIPASQHKRFINFLIDTYFLIFIGLSLWYLIYILYKIILPAPIIFIYIPVSIILYYSIFEGIWGKTPAKFITETKVSSKKNKLPEINSIIIRTISRLIPLDALSYFFVGNPIGWHDWLSKTLVIDEKYTTKSSINPFIRFLILILDLIGFCTVIIITYLTFRYTIINVLPDLKYLNNLTDIIADEISTITEFEVKIKDYYDNSYGISLKHPGNWIKIGELDNPEQPVVLFIKTDKIFFRIHKPETAFENMALDIEYIKEFLDISQTGKILYEGNITINYQKFYKYTISDKAENKKLKILNYLTFKNDKIYIFSYAAFNEDFNTYLPVAQLMFNSIYVK